MLERVDITYISPCLAEPDKIRLKARLGKNIEEVLPYLNAVMEGASFNPAVPCITIRRDFRVLTLYPEELTMIKAENSTDAMQIIEWLKKQIRDIWERKEEIIPDYTRSEKPHPLMIYKQLPGTNCGACGETNCMAFAFKLLGGEQEVDNCRPLKEGDYHESREMLNNLFVS